MGLFGKRQSSITFAPGATNIDQMARNVNGMVGLDQAKRLLQLSEDQTLNENGIWRIRSADCNKLTGDGYWLGLLKPKGKNVGIYVNNKHVGYVEPRHLESAQQMLKEYGGNRVQCVISNSSPSSWNIYVNML